MRCGGMCYNGHAAGKRSGARIRSPCVVSAAAAAVGEAAAELFIGCNNAQVGGAHALWGLLALWGR